MEVPRVKSAPNMFGGHWSSASGDIKSLVCQVTSESHMIEGSCNYECEFLIVFHQPAKFGRHELCGSGDIMNLVYQVNLQDLAFKGPSNFITESHSMLVTDKPSGHKSCGIGDKMVLVCQMIYQEHVIKESCYYIGRTRSRQVNILLSLKDLSTLVMEI